jgi:hypothetical protein
MKTHHDLETRLRAEARQAGPGPSPHLHTRIMADVRTLHAERARTGASPWVGILAGVMAVLVMAVMELLRLSNPAPVPAPMLAQAGGWHAVKVQATAVSNELHNVVMDPFAQEFEALSADTAKAGRFLADCFPL